MPQLILILLKINLVLLLFAAGYYLVLRRLTFYTLNRIFLVLGIVFSSVYPFIDLTELFYQQQNLNPELERIVPALQEGMKNLVQADPMSLFWDAMIVLFWTGTAVMAFRLAMQFFSLYRIHRKSTPGAVKGYPVRMLTDELSPFSFWQTIYINPELHPREELKTILEHEHIHVKQWHTLDIILAELSLVFYWFNPGVWLMKKAVRENIEFITDARILRKGIDRKEYQYSLLDVGRMTASPALVNNFNLSDLKKRIMMMNSRRSSPVKVYRYLLLLPVLMVLTLSFTVSRKAVKRHIEPFITAFAHVKATAAVPAEKKNTQVLSKQLKRKSPRVKQPEKAAPKERVFVFMIDRVSFSDSLDLPEEIAARLLYDKMSEGTVATFTDTLKEGLRDIRIQVRHKDGPVPMGDPTLEKKVLVRAMAMGGKMTKVPDSLPQRMSAFYLNGKAVSKDELDKMIKPENVSNVMIRRAEQGNPGIHIETKN